MLGKKAAKMLSMLSITMPLRTPNLGITHGITSIVGITLGIISLVGITIGITSIVGIVIGSTSCLREIFRLGITIHSCYVMYHLITTNLVVKNRVPIIRQPRNRVLYHTWTYEIASFPFTRLKGAY